MKKNLVQIVFHVFNPLPKTEKLKFGFGKWFKKKFKNQTIWNEAMQCIEYYNVHISVLLIFPVAFTHVTISGFVLD